MSCTSVLLFTSPAMKIRSIINSSFVSPPKLRHAKHPKSCGNNTTSSPGRGLKESESNSNLSSFLLLLLLPGEYVFSAKWKSVLKMYYFTLHLPLDFNLVRSQHKSLASWSDWKVPVRDGGRGDRKRKKKKSIGFQWRKRTIAWHFSCWQVNQHLFLISSSKDYCAALLWEVDCKTALLSSSHNSVHS